MTTVDLVLSELTARDAIGSHTMQLRRLLVEEGHEVRLVVEAVEDRLESLTTPLDKWKKPSAVVVLQHGTGSVAAQHIIDEQIPCVVNYHNVTPAHFFEPWEPHIVPGLNWGRGQMEALAPLARLGIGDSAFNTAELVEAGYPHTAVAPIIFDVDGWRDVKPEVPQGHPGPVWLFVGRVAPNKCHHDIISSFAAYRELAQPQASLVFIGGVSSPHYADALDALVDDLDLRDSVLRLGSISRAELAGWFTRADVFVCLSEHEGFCVPLLEAMYFETPTVAYDSSAVGETLAGAGIMLTEKSPVSVAVAVDRVIEDPAVRARVTAAAARRLGDFDPAVSRATFSAALSSVIQGDL